MPSRRTLALLSTAAVAAALGLTGCAVAATAQSNAADFENTTDWLVLAVTASFR